MKNDGWSVTADRPGNRGVLDLLDVSPPAEFQAHVRHERSRSDRIGGEFSLAVFDMSGISSNGRGMQRVAHHIRQKTRSIDEVGWVDSQSLGVLLPATTVEGAHGFVHRIGEPVSCTVYTYPAHWLPTSNGGSGGAASPGKVEDTVAKILCRRVPFWKCCMDVAGSAMLIALLLPLFAVVGVYMKCVSSGSVFYRQTRVGYRGKPFTIIKFRTMHENNNPAGHREYLKCLIRSGGPMVKLDGQNDPRIIPGGRVIRMLCVDELPQLFNVLRGEMSLVGPRPCIPYEADEYLRWHTHRFDTLPGMTGLWQVSGKNRLTFEQMIRLDISYAKHMSPLLDLKILLLTGPAIARMVCESARRRLRAKLLKPVSIGVTDQGEEGPLGDT